MKNSLLLAAFVSGISVADASAAPRAFISGKGRDAAGCGPIAMPCRTPQYAHDNVVAAGGEIDILDPAGYGAITITKAMSIINDGVGIAGFLASDGGNAITINAAAGDSIVLRGLTLEGSGRSNGIVYNSGGQLTVRNCLVQKFYTQGFQGAYGHGIWINPAVRNSSHRIEIADTLIDGNRYGGVVYDEQYGVSANANLILDGVTSLHSQEAGIGVAHGGSATVAVSISRSTASQNGVGIAISSTDSAPLNASIEGSYTSYNNAGLTVSGGVKVYLGTTDITLNSTGIQFANSDAMIYTYGTNQIDNNPVAGGSLTFVAQK